MQSTSGLSEFGELIEPDTKEENSDWFANEDDPSEVDRDEDVI